MLGTGHGHRVPPAFPFLEAGLPAQGEGSPIYDILPIGTMTGPAVPALDHRLPDGLPPFAKQSYVAT